MQDKFYSENWHEATEKFVANASCVGKLRWCVSDKAKYDIP